LHCVWCEANNATCNVKIKCTLVQALRLCTAHRGSRGIALLFLTAALEEGEGSASRLGHYLPPGKTRYPFYRRMGGTQGRSGRAENLVPTGIRSPDRPARSKLLYRLSYPAHNATCRIAFSMRWHLDLPDAGQTYFCHEMCFCNSFLIICKNYIFMLNYCLDSVVSRNSHLYSTL